MGASMPISNSLAIPSSAYLVFRFIVISYCSYLLALVLLNLSSFYFYVSAYYCFLLLLEISVFYYLLFLFLFSFFNYCLLFLVFVIEHFLCQ